MPFQKGHKLANGGVKKLISPVTLSNIKKHYERWCQLLDKGDLEIELEAQVLAKLVPWEHAELFGKPREKVEVSGKDGAPLQANIIFGYKPGGSE